MTVDQANTALAVASTKEQRTAAYKALSLAAFQAANNTNKDESEGYALITRLIEARNVLTMAAQYLADASDGHGLRAIDELDQAMVHITLAIEAL